jgi:hypothetical protein
LLDLGCGVGGSLISASRRFGVDGLGLERNRQLVIRGQEAGREVYEGDVLDLRPDEFDAVRYIMLDNVLEHLPDLDAVEAVLGVACRMASRMVHVRHPSFEDEEYLASLDLKQYWTDWPGPGGHTAKVRLHEFVAMAARLGQYHLEIRPVNRALDAADTTILPLAAPSHQTRSDPEGPGVYDIARHGSKPSVTFDRPVYFAYDLCIFTGHDRPQMTYLFDPERDAGRPFFTWPGEPPPPFLVRWQSLHPPDPAQSTQSPEVAPPPAVAPPVAGGPAVPEPRRRWRGRAPRRVPDVPRPT